MTLMSLKVLLPFEVFAQETRVSSIVVETVEGSYGLLPHRLDCVAALVPGILCFTDHKQGEVFLALDAGVLVKTGQDVVISVRRALRSKDLTQLQNVVEQQFLTQDALDIEMRAAMNKLETGFMRRLSSLRNLS